MWAKKVLEQEIPVKRILKSVGMTYNTWEVVNFADRYTNV